MDVPVAQESKSHTGTIACASLLRGICHLHPASLRHSVREPPGQWDAGLVPGKPFGMSPKTFRMCASVSRLGHRQEGEGYLGFFFFPVEYRGLVVVVKYLQIEVG
jgi:hypothetical protein